MSSNASKRLKLWRSYRSAANNFFESPLSVADDLAVSQFFASHPDPVNLSSDQPVVEPVAEPSITQTSESVIPADLDSDSVESHEYRSNTPESGIIDNSFQEVDEPKTFAEVVCGARHVLSEEQQLAIRDQIAGWAAQYRPTREQANGILCIMNAVVPVIPKDVRTLLETVKKVEVVDKFGGQYSYFGILNALVDNKLLFQPDRTIDLQINIDGIPLFHSRSDSFWPILMTANGSDPLLVALFYGKGKPSSIEGFMYDFVEEYKALAAGFIYQEKNFDVSLSSVVGDAPARSFMKQVVGHNGLHGCERCCAIAVFRGRVCYNDFDAYLRTDAGFRNHEYDGTHQNGESPFSDIVNCVTGFPLDYMHLVCLGVMRRMVKFWKTDKASRLRLSQSQQNAMSSSLQGLHGLLPSDFARQPRPLHESDRWKATEWRQFLLYTGMIVLHEILPIAHYHHFMCLSVAMSILLNDDSSVRSKLVGYARGLLVSFVKEARFLYGEAFISYNVHSLIHLADDCENFNTSLNDLSSFPYENYLGQLKRLVRNATNPIAQVAKRMSENPNLVGTKTNVRSMKLTANTRDGVVKLKSGKVAFITDICGERITAQIVSKRRLNSIFDILCDSLAVGIGKVRKSTLSDSLECCIMRSDIDRKMVCLPYNDGTEWALIPVHHTYS